MVVTAQRLATQVGADILHAGGNAVDAAVAVGYAEAVVNPCCGNIGGGGFLTLRLADGRATFLDFRETAPAAASAGMYLDPHGKPVPRRSLDGWRAVGVPGTVAGLDAALQRYGTMRRAQVMAPAIRLARDGFVLTAADADILHADTRRFAADPAAARVFLHPDGSPFQAGERLVQTDLAATLQAISDAGPAAFYAGRVPAAVEAASRAGGGLLTAADFAAYRAQETPPLQCAYRGLTILSAPPPSSGGATLCEILGVLGGYDLNAMGFHSAAAVHVMAEAMRHAFFDRNTYLGDPAFVANPLDWLLSDAHFAAIRAAIGPRATPTSTLRPGVAPHEQSETTSYVVVDAAGNAASVTYTLNNGFGAGVMAPGTGVLMNDEMDDFATAAGVGNLFGLVQGTRNAIAPGKRPLSSMAPTIVLRDGHLAYLLGSPGGSRIITIVAEVLMNLTDHGMAPQAAVDAPRLHMQGLPDTLFAEPFALSPDTESLLRGEGYRIVEQTPWGAAELIAVGAPPAASGPGSSGNDSAPGHVVRAGMLYGANDPRRPAGSAIGQ
jgi:gamma-glutamyltranspeptidase/glutathione hydrolase